VADQIGIGIIGMGFIGQTHARAFRDAARDGTPCAIHAVCDPNPDRRSGLASDGGNLASSSSDDRLFDSEKVNGYDSADELLADDSVDLVCICTPTDTHVDLAIRALDAGRHVLVEKPVATSSAEVLRLLARAEDTDRLCIPAMCVRYWPGWSDLIEMVTDARFGPVLHARFERLGSPPTWSSDFYADTSRSGNAIFDLHVHDADFVHRLFGRPEAVRSRGDDRHIVTECEYPDIPCVSIEGGWLNDASFPFRMAFAVEFERAVVTFDSRRDQPLHIHTGAELTTPDIGTHTGFDEQARAICAGLLGDSSAPPLPTVAEALRVTEFIEAERRSSRSGHPISLR
jgi:predicted dehydrogenase